MKNDSICCFFLFAWVTCLLKLFFGVYVASTDLLLAKGLIQNYSELVRTSERCYFLFVHVGG